MTSSRHLRTLAVLLVGAAALLLVPQAAGARETPYGTATMSNFNPNPGDVVEMTVIGCDPGATITYEIEGVTSGPLSVVADDEGSTTIAFTIPEDLAPKRYLTYARCPDPEFPDVFMFMPSYFDIVAAEPTPEVPLPDESTGGVAGPSSAGTLPRTGPGNGVLLGLGTALVALGGLLTITTRRVQCPKH